MDKNKLQALRARLWSAKVNGYTIANAAEHAAALEAQCGPTEHHGVKNSVEHLIALIEKALKSHGPTGHTQVTTKSKPAPKPAPAPEKKAAPKVETTQKEKTETAPKEKA